MGNQQTKTTAPQRQETAARRAASVQETRDRVARLRNEASEQIAITAHHAALATETNPFAPASELERALITQKAVKDAVVTVGSGTDAEIVNAQLLLSAAQVADEQLRRGGGAFTKSDYIAILYALDPSLRNKHAMVRDQTCESLRAKIRTIIYDPARFVSGTTAHRDATPAMRAIKTETYV